MTDSFVGNILEFGKRNIPDTIQFAAKSVFLDYLGVMLAGKRLMEDQCHDLMVNLGNSMQSKALIGGICAHVLELDDGHRIGMVHSGAPVISALLAVTDNYSVTWEDLLRGIVVGYEAAIRLACAVQPGHKYKHYHATGTCGTVGAAMGIASMLGFNFIQTKSAFSAAATSAAGILEMIDGDTQMKPYNAGRAAMDGVTSAFVGKACFKSPVDALGGKRGFLEVMTDDPKTEYLTEWPEGRFMINSIYRKPYAACRHCHPAIDASIAIREMPGFSINNIDSIHVDTYGLAVPGHDHTDIQGVNSAKMSIPYSVAVSLFTGKAGMSEYGEDNLNNPEILGLTHRVTVSSLDELTALCPQRRVAIVKVTSSNRVFVQRVDFAKGEPENPLTQEELETKFLGLAKYGGQTESSCKEVINEVFNVGMDLSRILKLIRFQ